MSFTFVPPEGEFFDALRAAPVDQRPLIKAEFDRRIAEGLPVARRVGAVAIDPDSRRELVTAYTMAGDGLWPEGGFWRLSDNTNLPLSASQMRALGAAAAGYYQALFGTRSALLDAAAAGAAPDTAAGWPEPVVFDSEKVPSRVET